MQEMLNVPTIKCQCYPGARMEEEDCMCSPSERACRAWIGGRHTDPMTDDQRAWCVAQIRSCGDATDQPDSFDDYADPDLVRAVLSGWTDYARDKGLL